MACFGGFFNPEHQWLTVDRQRIGIEIAHHFVNLSSRCKICGEEYRMIFHSKIFKFYLSQFLFFISAWLFRFKSCEKNNIFNFHSANSQLQKRILAEWVFAQINVCGEALVCDAYYLVQTSIYFNFGQAFTTTILKSVLTQY